MRLRNTAALGLSLLMMTNPLTAIAAEDKTVELTPPEQMPAAVGAITLSMDSSMNGMHFEIHRVQEEGEFVYYSYRPALFRELTVTCPVWEGDYVLFLTTVSDDSPDLREYRYEFTIADPENDPEQSFDTSEILYQIDVDPSAEKNAFDTNELGNQERVLRTEYQQVLARTDFSLGDLNADGQANAADAAELLIAAAALGAGSDPGLTSLQAAEADLNGDGLYNSADASELLRFAAISAAGDFSGSLLDFMLDGETETDETSA